MKLFNTIRTHWKKSLFSAVTVSYGTYYLINRKYNAELLQAYCFEALKYSKDKLDPKSVVRRVTVFINPVANGERGRFLYDTNVAPLLHLAGLDVRLIRLERNSEANDYMKTLDLTDTDCIVVAGGNATLNECISGLVNRPDSNEFLQKIPFGLIPIGETNIFAKKWFMKLGIDLTDEENIRLCGDSAMSIIKGQTMSADMIKVTLSETENRSKALVEVNITEPIVKDENPNDRGAYSLLEENKIYALSNVSLGFVTETDSQIGKYWYFGWGKTYMNRYFTDRYLRRQPIRYNFNYKLKCHGCSKCLNKKELKLKLDNFINKKSEVKPEKVENAPRLSVIQVLYRIFIGIGNFQPKETELMKENRLKTIKNYESLIRKSEKSNENCGQLFITSLIQSQVEANINSDPILENNEENKMPSSIETVVVKDPKFNFDDMFLAQKREISEFEISKSNNNDKGIKFKKPEDNMENVFCVEIDGEVYKLDNRQGHEQKVRVEHLEKSIKLLKYDPVLSKSIQVNYQPRIYMNKMHTGDMPPIRPFENLYIEYSKKEDLLRRVIGKNNTQ